MSEEFQFDGVKYFLTNEKLMKLKRGGIMIPKFRAWINSKNKMVDVVKIDLVNKEITYRIDNEFFNDDQGNTQIGVVAKLKDVVLMQSIGLCDAEHKKNI